jgi:hypothetical protein
MLHHIRIHAHDAHAAVHNRVRTRHARLPRAWRMRGSACVHATMRARVAAEPGSVEPGGAAVGGGARLQLQQARSWSQSVPAGAAGTAQTGQTSAVFDQHLKLPIQS